jgi:hypothetical protein
MKSLLQLGRLVLCLGCCAAWARATDVPPSEPVRVLAATVAIPEGVPADAVQEAIVRADAGRAWTIKEKGDGRVVLFLAHGGWRSTLTLEYDAREVKVFSNSAKLDRKGRPKKYAVPERWVNYLKLDLTKHLGESVAKS